MIKVEIGAVSGHLRDMSIKVNMHLFKCQYPVNKAITFENGTQTLVRTKEIT